MFLSENYEALEKHNVKLFQKQYGTFTSAYEYWKDNLFERLMRLFVWENTDPVPAHEIEMRLLLAGTCGIINFKESGKTYGELTAMFGHHTGVSKYLDMKPDYQMHCPIWAGVGKIGEDVAVIWNNSLKNPSIDLVDRYAFLLAHTEVTLALTMVSARDSGGVPVATSSSQEQSINTYQRKLYNGEAGVVTDLGALGVEYAGVNRSTDQRVVDIMEVRQKLLKNFYADIGIRASFEKRSNAVTDEVEADTTMLLFNDDDMLKKRQEGAEAVNDLFGTNWSVKLNPSIEMGLEKGGVEDATIQKASND